MTLFPHHPDMNHENLIPLPVATPASTITTIHAGMRAEVTRYYKASGRPTRYWAVKVDGELLAVTLYRKGAEAVAATINAMSQSSQFLPPHAPVNPHANGSSVSKMVKNMA